MKLNLTKDWYERNIEKEEETMNLDAAIRESIRISRSDVGYSYEKMQSVACILAGEVERLEADIERLEADIKQIHKDYGCEIQDPSRTIWDHVADIYNRLAEKNAEINRLLSIVHKYKTGGLRR